MVNSIYFKMSLIIIVILSSSVVAHASDWHMFRGDIQRTGFVNDYIPPPFEVAWKTDIGSSIYSSPVFMNDSLYIGSTDGFLYALNANDGKIKWKAKTNRSIYSSPAVEGGLIFVGSNDGYFYAFDTNGNKRWNFKTGRPIRSSPLIKDGLVYFGSDDGNLYAINADSGILKWKILLNELNDEWLVRTSPTIGYDDVIYVPTNVHLYAIYNGSLKWKKKIGFTAPLPAITPLPAVIGTNVIYTISKKEGMNTLSSLNSQNGNQEQDVVLEGAPESRDFPAPLVYFNNRIYMSYTNLYRIENSRLEKIFSTGDALTVPLASKDMIHAGSQKGHLYSVGLNGNLINSLKVSDKELVVGAIGNKKLYVTSIDGYIYGLSSTVLVAEDALASANSTIEHAASIGVNVAKVQLILERGKNKFTEGKFKEAIFEAEGAEKTAKDFETTYVKTKITNAETVLNEIRTFGFEINNLEHLLQDSENLLSKNESKQAIEKAEYVETFSKKILSIKIKLVRIDELYGNASLHDDDLKTAFRLLDDRNYEDALEMLESIDTGINKDINGWNEIYTILIVINFIPIVLIISSISKKFLS